YTVTIIGCSVSKIPEFYLEIAPFVFSLFLNGSSFFQDKVVEFLLTQEILKYYPKLQAEGAIPTIVGLMLDLSQRLNFLVTVVTSLVAAAVIGFQKDAYWFLLGSLFLFVVVLYLGVLSSWRIPLGRGKDHWYTKPGAVLPLSMAAINV